MTYPKEAVGTEIEWQVAHGECADSVEAVRGLAYRVLTVLSIELRLGVVDDIEAQIRELVPSFDRDDCEEGFAFDVGDDQNYDRYGVRVLEHPPLTLEEEEELVVRYPDRQLQAPTAQ